MNRILTGILLSVMLMLSGCAGNRTYEVLSLEDITIQQIEETIRAGNPAEAIQDLSAIARVRTIEPNQYDELYAKAESELQRQLKSRIESGDYIEAFALAMSLDYLRSNRSDGLPDASNVLLDLARSYEDDGHLLPSLILRTLLVRRMAPSRTREDLLDGIRTDAMEAGYDSFARYATSQIGDAAITSVNSRSTEKSRMIAGTVTIWVNRGIRIERGVGYPDRVIGSGFFIDSDGYLITNYHVIESEVDPEYEGFSRLYIRPANDDTVRIPAKVVGWDRIFDLALLKVDVEPEYVFSPSLEDQQNPGDRIFAIGSPAGLNKTITSGIVSATGRRFFQIGDAMQVDVPINPGNSGGPLVNEVGDLIGVVFAGIEQYEGINFAIPSKWLNPAIPRLYLGGEVSYPWIGAVVEKVDEGLEVVYVLPGEPAQRAGIVAGDIIERIGFEEVSTLEESQGILMDLVPGTLVPIQWRHDKESVSGSVALTARPYLPMELALKRDIPYNLLPPLFGMYTEPVSRSFLLGNSYVVSRVLRGSIADEIGLTASDPVRIQSIDVDYDNEIISIQMVIEKQKVGFIDRAIQIGSYLEIDTFL